MPPDEYQFRPRTNDPSVSRGTAPRGAIRPMVRDSNGRPTFRRSRIDEPVTPVPTLTSAPTPTPFNRPAPSPYTASSTPVSPTFVARQSTGLSSSQPVSAKDENSEDDDWYPTLAESEQQDSADTTFHMPTSPAVPPTQFSAPDHTPDVAVKPTKRQLKLPRIPWRKLRSRKVAIAVLALVGLSGVTVGAYAGIRYLRVQASPDTLFADMLTQALSTRDVQISRQSSDGTSLTQLDLSDPKALTSSVQTTATIAGASFGLKGYGTSQNTYIAYTSLPSSVPGVMTGTIQNRWLQLRANGILPDGVPAALSNTADPRYQAFGPIIFANLPPTTRQKLVQFITTNHIYKYDLAMAHSVSLQGKKRMLFTAKLNVGYLKVANQSAASGEDFTPNDVQRAVDALDAYKGATTELYVDPSSHNLVQLTLKTDTQNVTYTYGNFNTVSVSAAPTSKLTWAPFAMSQLQMEAAVSAAQPAATRDAARQSAIDSIKTALDQYYTQTGFYPSLANLNSQTWLTANMPGFDPDVTRDPQATTLALLASVHTTPAPTTNAKTKSVTSVTPVYGYVYQPLSPTSKVCSNETIDQQCTSFTLTASLNSGKLYTVQSAVH